jgi:hypothetical protein
VFLVGGGGGGGGLLFLSRCDNNRDVSPNLIKIPSVKFDEISANGTRVAPCGKKDEYDFEEKVCVKSMKLHSQNTIT